jgi:hypothetical protein
MSPSAAALLPGLRRALHHLRAGAVARSGGDQVLGKREPFDRDKLERSIRIAMQKRPIEPERIDQMISGIVRRLESMGDTDVPSKIIGEIVMETLARIDTVAYVRFASVYKNFQAADDFDRFVSELRPQGLARSDRGGRRPRSWPRAGAWRAGRAGSGPTRRWGA